MEVFLLFYLLPLFVYIYAYYKFCVISYKKDNPDKKEVTLSELYNKENPFALNFIAFVPLANIAIFFAFLVMFLFQKFKDYRIKL